jgi:hypothetical protein
MGYKKENIINHEVHTAQYTQHSAHSTVHTAQYTNKIPQQHNVSSHMDQMKQFRALQLSRVTESSDIHVTVHRDIVL